MTPRPVAALFFAPSCLLEAALGLCAILRAVYMTLVSAGVLDLSLALSPLQRLAPLPVWALVFGAVGVGQLVVLGERGLRPRVAGLAAGFAWWAQTWAIAQTQPSVWWGPFTMVVVMCLLIAGRSAAGEAVWTRYRP